MLDNLLHTLEDCIRVARHDILVKILPMKDLGLGVLRKKDVVADIETDFDRPEVQNSLCSTLTRTKDKL
jgi:hypothetical protein